MNPYETTQPQMPEKKGNQIISRIKNLLIFAIVIIIFQGCFNLRDTTPINEATTFQDLFSVTVFHGLFVYPMGKLTISIHKIIQSTFATIFIVTFINRAIGSIFTAKSQVAAEKQKELNPYMQAINTKYAGKTDAASRMQKNLEIQKLYKKHNIKPMDAMAPIIVSMPLFLSVYTSIRNNAYLAETTMFGYSTKLTAKEILKQGLDFKIISLIILLVVFQWIAIKIPTILAKRNQKPHQQINRQQASMQRNMEIILPLMMLWISWQVTIAILVYFVISPIFTIAQSYIIHTYFINKKTKKENSVNELY